MKVIVAPDSFGGWRSAGTIASAVAQSLRRGGIDAEACPMSDGGEGLLDALASGGVLDRLDAVDGTGPAGLPRTCPVGRLGGVPIIESSAWLRTLAPSNPWHLHSGGLGAACRSLVGRPAIIGLGGSSTIDAGLGLWAALGGRLLDANGQALDPTPAAAHRLARVELDPDLGSAWTVWADVQTPYPAGARRFGPQKGVHADDLDRLTVAWKRVADTLDDWRERHGRVPIARDMSGGGAAGGLGFALACLGARLEHGAHACMQSLGLHHRLDGETWIVTGEGRLDATTRDAKVVATLAQHCRDRGQPFAALVGSIGPGAPDLPGPVYVCDTSPDRALAFEAAVQTLVTDLQRQLLPRPISLSRS